MRAGSSFTGPSGAYLCPTCGHSVRTGTYHACVASYSWPPQPGPRAVDEELEMVRVRVELRDVKDQVAKILATLEGAEGEGRAA